MIKQTDWFRVLKILVMLAAWIFLIYKLLVFENYDYVVQKMLQSGTADILICVAVFFLLPINILLEAVKWQVLFSNTHKISLKLSIKAVMAGMVSGFVTPNRIGDVAGRLLFIPQQHQKAGVTIALLNSLTQNISILLLGIPAALLFIQINHQQHFSNYLIMLFTTALLLWAFLYFMPAIARLLRNYKLLHAWIEPLKSSQSTVIKAITLSILRAMVFNCQLFLMFHFFDVSISIWQAAVAIPLCYLMVTFTPAMALSDVAIRSSYAVFIVGFYSTNSPGITIASMALWLINYIIPMLIGSKWFIAEKKLTL